MKNKTITIYELLGLIKDGKAPYKIKLDDQVYAYSDDDYMGVDEQTSAYCYLSSYVGSNYIIDIFTRKIEVLEESLDEFEDIEELDTISICNLSGANSLNGLANGQYVNNCHFKHSINQLIRNQKKIIERLNGEDNE
jgi:hypothetical protein